MATNSKQENRQKGALQPDLPVTKQTLSRAMDTLRRYRAGKSNLDRRIVENEQWWKLRHWDYIHEQGTTALQTKSGWLVNVLLSKHADAIDAFPEPNCLPREQNDIPQAKMLSAILPVVLDQNDFEKVWSDNWWKKLKAGAGIYGVYWDKTALNGLGDIAVCAVDPLKLFWEPGITDLQKSRDLFYVELTDNEILEAEYPRLCGKLRGRSFTGARYLYDDTVDTSGKSAVIDWYYHKNVGGRRTLQYVKFVGDEVLYATENDTAPGPDGRSMAQRGLYDHGKYPFVVDAMFPEEGTPVGFSYIDLCKDPQRQIDLMNNAIVANCIAAATPRWLVRGDGGINEEEYADWTKPFVHVQGTLDEAAIRQITVQGLSGNYLNLLTQKIGELKETSGNRDVSNGGTVEGVTAASAIAAIQEQSGKLSRDQIQNSYRCYRSILLLMIELIRQFYTVPRQFRITGQDGLPDFVRFDGSGLQITVENGIFRDPLFDIEVTAQKQNAYSKLSNNELALQLFKLGMFDPRLAPQAAMCMQMMEFKGKDQLLQSIGENAAKQTVTAQPAAVRRIESGAPRLPQTGRLGTAAKKETAAMAAARQHAADTTRPR